MDAVGPEAHRKLPVTGFLFLLSAAALHAPSLCAQTTFERTYGGPDWDEGYFAARTPDGGYVVAGHTLSFGAGGKDVYLIRTDAFGDTLWTRTVGGNMNDWARSAEQSGDGGLVIVGSTYSHGAGQADIYVVMTEPDGDTVWTRTFGGPATEWGYSATATADGGCLAVGFTSSFGAGSTDAYAVRTDTRGDTVWTRTYGGRSTDDAWSARPTSDGGFIIVGSTSSFGSGNSDIYLVKTDFDGDTLWTRAIGTENSEHGYSIQQITDSGFVIVGARQSLNVETLDVYLVRTDASGNVLWTKTYGGLHWDEGYSVQQTSDGGFALTGYTRSQDTGGFDVYIIKTDPLGDTLWTKAYGGEDGDIGYSIRQTADGGYIVVGMSHTDGSRTGDVFLIKTDSLGRVAVTEQRDKQAFAQCPSLVCKPNPSRGTANFRWQMPQTCPVTLRMYDAAGQQVRMLLDAAVRTGSCVASWNGTDYKGRRMPAGVYLVKLSTGGLTTTQKLVIQR